jgi:hypothetical protein
LLALATLAGLAGTLSLARRNATPAQRDAARACLLTFTAAVAVLLISDAFEFSWRYQLPALVTLPPAAALGLTALFARRRRESGQRPATAPAPASQAQPVTAPAGPLDPPGPPGPAGNGRGQGNGTGQEPSQARDRTPASLTQGEDGPPQRA